MKKLQLLFLVVGIAALTWMVLRIGPDVLLDGLQNIGWGFALTCAAHLCGLLLDSVVLRACAGQAGKKVPYLHFARASVSGHALNEATPFGKVGEITKYTVLAQKMSPSRAGAALVVQNISSFVVNCGLIALGAPVAILLFDARGGVAVLLSVISGVFLLAGVVGLWIFNRGVGTWPVRFLRKIGARFHLKKARMDRWEASWDKVEANWKEAADDPGPMLTAWLAAITSRMCNVTETALILHFIGADNVLPAAVLSLGASQAVNWTMSFVPFQAGSAEGAAYLIFRAAGLSPEFGVLVEIARKLRRVIFIGLGVSVLAWNAVRGVGNRPVQDP